MNSAAEASKRALLVLTGFINCLCLFHSVLETDFDLLCLHESIPVIKRLAEVSGMFFSFPAHVWSSGILFDPQSL